MRYNFIPRLRWSYNRLPDFPRFADAAYAQLRPTLTGQQSAMSYTFGFYPGGILPGEGMGATRYSLPIGGVNLCLCIAHQKEGPILFS